jgi:hypothetical protein
MSKPNVWVVRHPEGWAVKREGADRASFVTDTKQVAEQLGRAIAQRQHVELITQDRHGRIQSKDSFGHDPIPPRDTEH